MAVTRAMIPCFKETTGGRFTHDATSDRKRLQPRCLELAMFETQEVRMAGIENECFTGVGFLSRISSHYGVYIEFFPCDITLYIHRPKIAKRFRILDLLHSGEDAEIPRL